MQMTLRGRSVLGHLFELWVGLAGIVTGIVFFYSPASLDGNALDRTIGYGPAAAWTVAYLIAGLLIWVGLLKPSLRFEVTGLTLLGGATAANAIAIASVFGFRGAATAGVTFALALASFTRALLLTSRAVVIAQGIASHGR